MHVRLLPYLHTCSGCASVALLLCSFTNLLDEPLAFVSMEPVEVVARHVAQLDIVIGPRLICLAEHLGLDATTRCQQYRPADDTRAHTDVNSSDQHSYTVLGCVAGSNTKINLTVAPPLGEPFTSTRPRNMCNNERGLRSPCLGVI